MHTIATEHTGAYEVALTPDTAEVVEVRSRNASELIDVTVIVHSAEVAVYAAPGDDLATADPTSTVCPVGTWTELTLVGRNPHLALVSGSAAIVSVTRS